MVFSFNSRVQPNYAASPISRYYVRDVRGSLPNSLNRNLNWSYLKENRRRVHQKRVEKKGCCSKKSYAIGEKF